MGQFAKALADIDKYSPSNTPWERAYVLGRWGHPAEAQQAMEGLRQLDRRYPVDPAAFTWAWVKRTRLWPGSIKPMPGIPILWTRSKQIPHGIHCGATRDFRPWSGAWD
jgi:hypothetical protein